MTGGVLGAAGPQTGPAASAGLHAERYVPGQSHLERMTAAGTCWGNDGHQHPIPSRAWVAVPWSGSGDVRYVLRGQSAVDAILTSGDYSRVARFCE